MQPVRLETSARPLPASSWVTLTSGERIELRNGRLTRDSVIGSHAQLRRAIPRDSVVAVNALERPSAVPFVMLGALVAAGLVSLLTSDLGLTTK